MRVWAMLIASGASLLGAAQSAAAAAAADGEHGAAASEPSLFQGSLVQSLAAIIAFVVLLVILKKMAWGPMIQGLQDRENKIKDDLAKAEQANADAQKTLDDYKAQLAEAHSETRQMLDQARTDAEALRQKMTAEAEEEAARLRQRASDEIAQAKNQALQEIYQQSAELAVSVAGKILERQIDAKDTQQLVDQSLSELNRLDQVN